MQRKTLNMLTGVWGRARDKAQYALANCLKAETQAHDEWQRLEMDIVRERDIVATLPVGDGATEAFAIWLPLARQAVAQAKARHDEAVAATGQAHKALAAAMTKVEMGKTLIARSNEEERLEEAKRAQIQLSELVTVTAWKRQQEAEHEPA